MWFPFSFAKKLKGRHFVVDKSKPLKLLTNACSGASFQANLLSSFLLFFSVCYQDDQGNNERNEIASSTVRTFSNSWLLCVKFSKTIKFCLLKYLTHKKLKMSAPFIFEIKGAKKDNIFNFLKGSFSVMCDPMDIIVGVFPEIYVRPLTVQLHIFFSRYSKSYNNLNIKSCLKLNGP